MNGPQTFFGQPMDGHRTDGPGLDGWTEQWKDRVINLVGDGSNPTDIGRFSHIFIQLFVCSGGMDGPECEGPRCMKKQAGI